MEGFPVGSKVLVSKKVRYNTDLIGKIGIVSDYPDKENHVFVFFKEYNDDGTAYAFRPEDISIIK